MNIIAIIIYAILMPITIRYFFVKARESKAEAGQPMSDEDFIIRLPMNFFAIGVAGTILFGTIMLGFTLFPNEPPDESELTGMILFYIVFGGFLWLCVFLALKTVKFKVVVKGDKITVYSMLIKPYSFMFSEIVSVFREVKYNQLKSERMVIETITGKTLIVESAEISYERFLRRVKSDVRSEFLEGFD
jgi:hypothetical protein